MSYLFVPPRDDTCYHSFSVIQKNYFMKKVTLFICLFFTFGLTAQNESEYCLNNILFTKDVAKEEFLKCIKKLSLEQDSSSYIFSVLSATLLTSEYLNILDKADMYGYLPEGFDYFDFENQPKKIHRYRAIKNIWKTQLKSGNVDEDFILEYLEEEKDAHLDGLIISYNKNVSYNYLDYLYNNIFLDSIKYNSGIRKWHRKISVDVLISNDPEKYIDKISEYISVNFPNELYKYINHVLYNKLGFLSDGLREALIVKLFEQVRISIPFYAYSNVRAIEALSSLNFSNDIFEKFDYQGNEETVHKLIQQKAIGYYLKTYK